MRRLKSKMNCDQDLVIIKADKGNPAVLLKCADFDRKMLECLTKLDAIRDDSCKFPTLVKKKVGWKMFNETKVLTI